MRPQLHVVDDGGCSHPPDRRCWDCVDARDVSWFRLVDWPAVAVLVVYLAAWAYAGWHVVGWLVR